MTRLRRSAWIAVVTSVLAGALLALAVWSRPGVTRRNIKRISFGMTEEEFESVLGGPGHSRHSHAIEDVERFPLPPGCARKVWIGDDGFAVSVPFDERGVASPAAGHMVIRILREPTWLERTLDRLRIQRWP